MPSISTRSAGPRSRSGRSWTQTRWSAAVRSRDWMTATQRSSPCDGGRPQGNGRRVPAARAYSRRGQGDGVHPAEPRDRRYRAFPAPPGRVPIPRPVRKPVMLAAAGMWAAGMADIRSCGQVTGAVTSVRSRFSFSNTGVSEKVNRSSWLDARRENSVQAGTAMMSPRSSGCSGRRAGPSRAVENLPDGGRRRARRAGGRAGAQPVKLRAHGGQRVTAAGRVGVPDGGVAWLEHPGGAFLLELELGP